MSDRSTEHATFVIERTYSASPKQVFNAWADPAAKVRWFVGPEGWIKAGHKLDFRVGGTESFSGGPADAPVIAFKAFYQDIVPNQRIVYSYGMHRGETRISVSLATVELLPAEVGTRLIYTEQAVFLDGGDKQEYREQGTRDLLDNLDAELRRKPVAD